MTAPVKALPPSKRIPKPPELRYVINLPVSGMKLLLGSSVVIRHWMATPSQRICSCAGIATASLCNA